MNLHELRSVRNTERERDSLQDLRPSFYQEVGEYIAELEAEREAAAERAEDPFSSPEVSRLTDEIQVAMEVVEAIYERRMGKLVKQASLAAAGIDADDDGLTAEEADLFDDLVERIETNKDRVLGVLEGEGVTVNGGEPHGGDGDPTAATPPGDELPSPPPEPASDDPTTPADAGGLAAADVMGGETSAADGDADQPAAATDDPNPAPEATVDGDHEPAVDRVTVRITRDVGPILGIDDREYTLAADDIVTLPTENAQPLVERDAAEPLE